MAIMISRPRGSNTLGFRYKRLKRVQPAAAGPGAAPAYVKKLAWATVTVGGVDQRVEYQDKYTCAPGTFPPAFTPPPPPNQAPQPAAGITYADRLLRRPADKKLRCLVCGRVGAPATDCRTRAGAAGARDCTPAVFFRDRDARARLELRETWPVDLGVGVFTTAPLLRNTDIGLYTAELRRGPGPGAGGNNANNNLTALQRAYTAVPDTWSLVDAKNRRNKLSVYFDASERGNWTRFVNHHCVPNCTLQSAKVCGTSRVHYIRTGNRDIPAGTQLFVDYGRAFFRDGRRIRGGGCLCGSSKCHSKKRRPRGQQ